MAEDIADKIENAMKKGFIHSLILSILKKGPSHGYKIKKEINSKNLGFWSLQDSTLYTALKGLTDKGLIKFTEEFEGERVKKVYQLTRQGEKIFQIIIKRQKRIIDSLLSLLYTIIGENDPEINEFSKMIDITSPLIINTDIIFKLPRKSQIHVLERQRTKIIQRIEDLKIFKTKIDEKIEKLHQI